MERGDYSGAVRRVTTVIEVVVKAAVAREIEKAEGKAAAQKSSNERERSLMRELKSTRT
jgi:hypothetical protein